MEITNIMKMVEAFEQAQVLMTANELDVIAMLEKEPSTAKEISHRLNASERGMKRLLLVLQDLGLVRTSRQGQSAARFKPTRFGILCFGRNGRIRHWTSHQKSLFELWSRLSDSIRNDTPVIKNSHDLNVKSYAFGLMELYALHARKLQNIINLRGKIRLLDVGGGLGHYSISAAIDNQSLTATIIDRPEIIEMTREELRKYRLEGRISLVEGDALSSSWPNDFDVVLLGNILHGKSVRDVVSLILSSHKSLRPKGRIIINEWINGSQSANLFDINMLICTRDGHVWDKKELADLVRSTGFVNIRWKKFDDTNWILEAKK